MLSVHSSINLRSLGGGSVSLGFLSGTGTGLVALKGMGVRAGVRRNGVFATDSDGVGRASERAVCSKSWLNTNAGAGGRLNTPGAGASALVSSHGAGLESAPLSALPLPLSNVVVVVVASPAGASTPPTHSTSKWGPPPCGSTQPRHAF